MREALWPHHDGGSHAAEVQQYFQGKLHMPLEVLLDMDQSGAPVGFAELSIRSYADHSLSFWPLALDLPGALH
jgi:hypothetical protein